MFQKNPKQFYRELPEKFQREISNSTLAQPSKETSEDYWRNIWSKPVQQNSETTWLTNERQFNKHLPLITPTHTHQ
jgi:hypothetical protein